MEPQNAYIIGYLLGLFTSIITYLTWRAMNKHLNLDALDYNFPKVWDIGYNSLGKFSTVIYSLANKFIIGKGNIADFIRSVPFNTDGYHVATITIQFGLIKRKYKTTGISKEKPIVHSIILTRNDRELLTAKEIEKVEKYDSNRC